MKKRLSLIMAALLACMPLLAACNDADGPADGADSTTPPPSAVSTTAAPETTLLDTLPKEDYGGYEFRILDRVVTWSHWNMTAEEITGDTLNDITFKRQMALEERLGITVTESQAGHVSTTLSTAVLSQSHEYDLAIMPTGDALNNYKKSYIVDQSKIDTMNLDNPWWAKSVNDTINIGDKRYITFGEHNLVYYSGFYVYAFNKQMIDDRGLESPYELVKSGKWTWDKMYEMMQAAATDLNGDGTYNVAEDTLGFTAHVNHLRNLMLSSGETITQLDADGNPSYSGLTERYINVYDKFMNYFVDNPIVAVAGCQPNRFAGYNATPGQDNYADVFNLGRSLFQCTGTYQVRSVREANMEYGLVIPPKFEESQQDYVAPVYSAVEGMVIPSTTEDLDRTGLILETMGALSYDNLVDELITNILHYKCANNPTDIEMIDLIFEKGQIDIALANNFGSCANILNSLHTYLNHNVSSAFATVQKKFETDIAAAIEDPQA